MSQSVAKVWADDLAHIDLDVAVEAARMHYRESADWLMPAHVIRNARRVIDAQEREARIRRQLNPVPRPEISAEGIEIYRAEVRRLKALKAEQEDGA